MAVVSIFQKYWHTNAARVYRLPVYIAKRIAMSYISASLMKNVLNCKKALPPVDLEYYDSLLK